MTARREEEDLEFTILNKRQSKVYQIPPAASAGGHRAEDWKESIWIGRCKVLGKGTTLTIKLVDSESEALFAQCVIPNGEHEKYVEPVVDSSRYFVLKITNDQRHAFIGFGFSDRNDAFDFKSSLSDFRTRFVEREADETKAPLIAAPSKDLSLKEGQTITVNLKGLGVGASKRNEDVNQQSAASAGTTGGIPLLAPPPKVEKARPQAGPAAVAAPGRSTATASTNGFRPVAARETGNATQDPATNAPPENFANFQSAPNVSPPGNLQVFDRTECKAEVVSSGQKSFLDYILPTSLLAACSADTRSSGL